MTSRCFYGTAIELTLRSEWLTPGQTFTSCELAHLAPTTDRNDWHRSLSSKWAFGRVAMHRNQGKLCSLHVVSNICLQFHGPCPPRCPASQGPQDFSKSDHGVNVHISKCSGLTRSWLRDLMIFRVHNCALRTRSLLCLSISGENKANKNAAQSYTDPMLTRLSLLHDARKARCPHKARKARPPAHNHLGCTAFHVSTSPLNIACVFDEAAPDPPLCCLWQQESLPLKTTPVLTANQLHASR